MRDLKALLYSAPIALVSLLGVSGCMSTRSTSSVTESLDSLGISIRGLRESNIRLAYRDGLAVEQAADSIIMLAPDAGTRIRAHLWKIYSVPVIRQIYTQSEPLASIVDALAFSMQCREYFTTGLGKDRFGVVQQIAINAASGNEQRLVEINYRRFAAAHFDSLVSRISRWVAKHPLTNHVFERPSVLNELDDLLAPQEYTIGSAVGRIADDVDDLSGRLSLLAAQLPREARWQGEYVLARLSLEERLDRLDTTTAVLATHLAAIERDLRSGSIAVNIMGFQSLHAEIEAVLKQVSSERALVMEEIERMRTATLATAEEAAGRRVRDGLDQTEEIINRVLWKIGVFLAIAFVAAIVSILVLRRPLRMQSPTGNA